MVHRPDQRIRPVVAVTEFENLANFSGKWNLGQGMADLLISSLMDSDRVIVLERRHLGDVVGEIVRQGKELFRKEGRVERGRLMNARYLIRGSVTDFTVTGDVSGWFGAPPARGLFQGSRARVAIALRVTDVETGRILASVKTHGTASSGGFAADVNYTQVAFGGAAYFRTPLGRATEEAIERAVALILRDLPGQRWRPRVAEAGEDIVIVNGGDDVRVRIGDVFAVREAGRSITDPVSGETIETLPGPVVGRIKVTRVLPTSSRAVYLEGTARRDMILEPLYTER